MAKGYDLAYEDEFIEDESQRENEDDLGSLDVTRMSEAVVFSSDWTTETILNQIRKENILLNPKFQRRDAWTPKRKSKFIESIILGFPIPQLVFAETGKGKYLVLDGKQRLLSMIQFASSRNSTNFDTLKLTGLDLRSDLNGKSIEDLQQELDFSNDLRAFENGTIRTVIVKNWPNESFLYHVFLRLNTESSTLSPQELRLALNPGPFTDFIEEKSKTSKALREILKCDKPDFRMRDAELLLRYYAFGYHLEVYRGNLKEFLDDTCKILNGKWDFLESQIIRKLDIFEDAHKFISQVFQRNSYQKRKNGNYEARFNRAVFDIMLFAFADENTRKTLTGKTKDVKKAYERLCDSDPSFIDSIEQTTKSIDATKTRIHKWIDVLNKEFKLKIAKPKIGSNDKQKNGQY